MNVHWWTRVSYPAAFLILAIIVPSMAKRLLSPSGLTRDVELTLRRATTSAAVFSCAKSRRGDSRLDAA